MPFSTFEKDAHTIAGMELAPTILNRMREINPNLPVGEKVASAPTFIVERKEHRILREVVASYNDAIDAALGCQWYERQAEPLLR
jgi:hypothetical protein